MTSPASPPPTWRIGGREVGTRLRTDRSALVDHVLSGIRGLDHPDHDRAAQLRWIVGHNIDLVAEFIDRGGAKLDESLTADLVASAAIRAAEGSPLEALLQDYIGGTAAVWRVLADDARPDELTDLVALTDLLLGYLRSVGTMIVRGFEQESRRIKLGERDARFAVFSALISGAGVTSAGARSGIAVASRYLVVQLRWTAAAQPPVPGRLQQVPQVRQAHSIRRVLDDLADGEVLALLRNGAGTALVPLSSDPGAGEAAAVRDGIRRMSRALGGPVHAGAVSTDADGIPGGAVQAQEVLDLVQAIGRPPGAWFLDDVLVPYQLTRPGPARDRLANKMRPLDDHPDWEATLRAYLAAGHDRRKAAETLHIHPNTVDYRIRRVAEICGIDAADPAQRPAALAALCIRDLERHHR